MPTPEFILRLRERIGRDLLLSPGVSGVVRSDGGANVVPVRRVAPLGAMKRVLS